MPEPLLYLQSLGAAFLAGAVGVFALAGRRAVGPGRLNAACILGGCLGMAAGCLLLRWQLVWPPASALDRVVTVVIPAALSIELVAGCPGVGSTFARALRVVFVGAAPLVLLHGSIYLAGSDGGWTTWQAGVLVVICSALLAALWIPLAWLSQRSRSGLSIAGSLALAILCAGGAVMLGGYLKGGAITFALAGALAGVTAAARLIAPRLAPAIVALGVIQLFGVVGTGYFFGRLPGGSALGLLLAPLLCCVSELPLLRQRPAWVIGTLRLLLVSIPLVTIITVAKINFDRKMAPLLSQSCPSHAGDVLSSGLGLLKEKLRRVRSVVDPDRMSEGVSPEEHERRRRLKKLLAEKDPKVHLALPVRRCAALLAQTSPDMTPHYPLAGAQSDCLGMIAAGTME